MSKSSSTNQAAQMLSDKVLEIEQCLFPVPEEFFMKRPDQDEECGGSVAFSESSDIPSIPSYTKLAALLDRGLSPEVIEKLCFNEMLLISDDNDEIVGGLAVQVETIADEVIAVFCSSQFTMGEDRTARSELLALTDKQFNPFQERKCETVLAGDLKQEKQLQLYFEEDQCVTAYRQETLADKSDSFQGTLNVGDEDGLLVPDGLNILFMRYLVLTGYTGDIHTRTIDIDGRIGHSMCQIRPAAPCTINGEVQDTRQVIRTIFYPDADRPEVSTSLYLCSGHLLRHSWDNSKYSIVLNPRASLSHLPIDMEDLCTTMRIYLEELAKLLEGAPKNASRSSINLPKQSEIVRTVISEILRDATEKAAAAETTWSPERSLTPEAARDVLIDLINQMSLC